LSVRIDYEEFLAGLAIDLIAISVLTYALYFRRHQRRDLTLGLMGINVGLFAVSSFTATTSISIGFGIGLFALLSVIRLRSTVASQEEIGYYFVALVIGLVNGLAVGDRWSVAITLNVVLLGVMFVADHPRVLRHAERRLVLLKGVPRSTESLTAKLEDLLGYEVTRLQVLEIDYTRRRTHVDVRFRTDRPVAPRDSTSVGGQPETPPEEAD
jgi:ABC-type cobalamin transport system permease subunit